MRFHLIGLAHLPTTSLYASCAFTQKNVKLAKMLLSLDHEVYLYGAKSRTGDAPACTAFIETHTVDDIARDYGDGDNRFEVGYDWRNSDFRHDFNAARRPSTRKFTAACIEAINATKRPDDFLLLTQGVYHQPIADSVGLFLRCEPGIGYRGSLAANFRAFESSYIQNFTYGSEHPFECINGSHYDRVIPNYFDPDDIEFSAEKHDYYLFIGRMIKRKGILIAFEACQALGAKLLIAGQGAHVDRRGHLVPNEDPDFDLPPGTWEYVGYADIARRKQLMAHAIATFTPTEYLECFAGTHVESMLSGTPPITTNFGVFPGTIPDHLDGVVGFRCDTLQDFVEAAREARLTCPREIASYAQRFTLTTVRWQFEKWFRDLYAVYESAMDSSKKGWSRVNLCQPS